MPDYRAPILALFDRYEARFPEEQQTVARIRQFVQDHEDCFERSQLKGHITGSAWILDSTGSRALLTHHKKLNIWVQPGGHADGDPDVKRVAMTEAIEESGLPGLRCLSDEIFDIDIHAIPARKGEPEHYHYDCRFLLRASGDDYVVSEESHDLAWIPLDRMTDYTTEASILRMVKKGSGLTP